MFFFITTPYNRITKLTQESEDLIYEKNTPLYPLPLFISTSHNRIALFLFSRSNVGTSYARRESNG